MKNKELYKLHHRLCDWIKKTGNKSWKKHGNYWDSNINGIKYHLDDYNFSCSAVSKHSKVYFGIDFGGFEPEVDKDTYRWHIGTLYKHWLKKKL